MEYRHIPEEHTETVRRMLRYAFGPERGPDLDDDDHERPEIYHRRGLYDVDSDALDAQDASETPESSGVSEVSEAPEAPETVPNADDLRVMCAYYDFTARIRGNFHRVGGVSAVASPPESRRQGYIADLLDELHREFREEGIAFAALWPFKYEFYRRFGYAMANKTVRTTVPPADLGDIVPDPAGRFRRLEADDFEELNEIHRSWATEALAIDRTEGWWRHRAFRGWRKDPYAYGWEGGEGEDGDEETLRGYIFYTVEKDGDDKRMDVYELAAVDEEARGQLIRFCRDHDSQVDSVRFFEPVEDARFLDGLTDPRAAEARLQPGPMVRIVDLEAAVDALSFPADATEGANGTSATGSVTLDVSDDHCDWNDGLFELAVGDEGVTCLRRDRDSDKSGDEDSDNDADVSLDIGVLSQLAVGSRSVADLERDGELTIANPEPAETLAALFPTERVYLREGF